MLYLLYCLIIGLSIVIEVKLKSPFLLPVAVILLLFISGLVVVKSIGINKTLMLAFFLSLSFNVEQSIYGEAFNAIHTGGLRANIAVSHTYIILIVWAFYNREPFKSIGSSKLRIEMNVYVLMVLAGCISFIYAPNKVAAIYLITRLIIFMLTFFILHNFSVETVWKYFIIGSMFIGLFQFLMGVGQLTMNNSLGLTFLGENSNPFRGGTEGLERGVSGTLGHPGTYAIFLTLIYPILLTQYIYWKKSFKRNILIISIIVCFLGILISNARTSIVIVLVSTFIIILGNLLIRNRVKLNITKLLRITITFSVILVVSSYFIIDQVLTRFFSSDFLFQIGERNKIGDLALEIIFKDPMTTFFGVGLNNYTDVISSFGQGFIYSHPVHNYYLLLWAEGGMLHLFLFIFLTFIGVFKTIEVTRKASIYLAPKALGVLVSIMSLVIYNLTGWSNSHNQIFILYIVLVGLSGMLYEEFKIESKKKI